ncbi:Uncharacterised protein [Vibrio cholerae]|nr:Uncharacterised protein [Vibrio cholerae]
MLSQAVFFLSWLGSLFGFCFDQLFKLWRENTHHVSQGSSDKQSC